MARGAGSTAVPPGAAGGGGVSRRALYPGSFDPVTRGHQSLIRRAAALFPSLVVAVVYNPNKEALYSLEERLAFLRAVTAGMAGVEVAASTGELLVDFARRLGATTIVRGLRDQRDVPGEFAQSWMNHHLAPDLETIFLPAEPGEREISSSLARQRIRQGQDPGALVPPVVRRAAGWEANDD